MFCPSCGAGEQSPNAYCKRCGQWLADQVSGRGRTAKTPAEKMKVMLVFNGLSAMFALCSAIALYASIDTPHAKVAMLVAGAFCGVIAVHQMVSFFFTLQLRQRFNRGRGDSAQAIGSAAGGRVASLSSGQTTEFISAQSVTENSTELLEAVPRVREQEN